MKSKTNLPGYYAHDLPQEFIQSYEKKHTRFHKEDSGIYPAVYNDVINYHCRDARGRVCPIHCVGIVLPDGRIDWTCMCDCSGMFSTLPVRF
jgi:hypothetical protein